MTLARGAAAFCATIAVALAGSALVFVEVESAPAPSAVLRDAQRFVPERALTFTATLTTTAPAPDADAGSSLVRRQALTGSARAGSADWTVTSGPLSIERRRVAGRPGLWVRGASTSAALGTARWAHAPDEAAVVAALAGGAASTAPRTAQSIAELEAQLAAPTAVADLVRAASHPRRDGRNAHRLVVSLDRALVAAVSGAPVAQAGASVEQAGAPVDQATATLATDEKGHPQRLVVEIRSGQALIDVAYTVAWDRAAPVDPPPPDLVVAEI